MLDLDYSRRHIIFNGVSDSYHDLVMAGNTPLLIPKPKRSSVEVAYSNGTVDTSELNGDLYFEDYEISYVFTCKLLTVRNGVVQTTEQMNGYVNDKIQDVEDWLYSGPATLTDYGLPKQYANADCTSITSEKVASPSYWMIKFTVTFRFPFDMTFTISFPYQRDFSGRYLVFNGQISSNIGLVMIGSTPTTSMTPKTNYMDWPKKNGSLNLTHCKDGASSGKDSMFYRDRTITYKFVHFIDKGTKNPCQLNLECQNYVDMVCSWLYHHSSVLSFVTIDGMITYGGTESMLIDSGWIDPDYDPYVGGYVDCDCLPSARCTGFNASKILSGDKWGVSFEITFTTYPRFSSCTLYIPPVESPTHDPEITYREWQHYTETFTNERNTATLMCEQASFTTYPGLYLGTTNEDFSRSWTFDDYQVSSGQILMSYDIDIPEYIDESIPEGYPCVAITMPYFFDITIKGTEGVEDVTHTYIPQLYSPTMDYLYAGYDIYQEGSSSATSQFYPSVIFDKLFAYQGVSVVLTPLTDAFTEQELEDADVIITIDFKYHYLKYIAPDDIQEEYGLWANEEAYCPNTYSIYTKAVADLREDPPAFGNNALTFIPFNKPNQTGDYKFEHPRVYTTQGPPQWVCWLDAPLVDNLGNQYIWCDSAKPDGSDIQWLQP